MWENEQGSKNKSYFSKYEVIILEICYGILQNILKFKISYSSATYVLRMTRAENNA